ncbi:hypothetical protein [Chelativorans sp. AA-79]|uniref:hypothetical protein n=1 Tax=Chelativorans sp. AA-79 TaxID=3028735 RepID=UPI0023F77495|nr:hypothetical protein [Chelativorans sp. AA-79]WEX07857.1 hypothetical protein PVE73_17385 [Chelativorans sp. AA-79]
MSGWLAMQWVLVFVAGGAFRPRYSSWPNGTLSMRGGEPSRPLGEAGRAPACATAPIGPEVEEGSRRTCSAGQRHYFQRRLVSDISDAYVPTYRSCLSNFVSGANTPYAIFLFKIDLNRSPASGVVSNLL